MRIQNFITNFLGMQGFAIGDIKFEKEEGYHTFEEKPKVLDKISAFNKIKLKTGERKIDRAYS